MIQTYSLKRDGEKRLTTNFRVKEFRSQDGADEIRIDDKLVKQLQLLRDCLGLSSLVVISGFRTPYYNKKIGGSPNSRHLDGIAADVQPFKDGKPLDPKYLCCAAEVIGMTGIALIQTCAHLDTRDHTSWFDENKGNTPISVYGHKSWFTYCGVKDLAFMLNPFKVPREVLRKGSKGDGVKWLQFELIRAGCLPLISASGKCNIDGAFGDNTVKAVLQFQKGRGLVTDGIVGSQTKKMLA